MALVILLGLALLGSLTAAVFAVIVPSPNHRAVDGFLVTHELRGDLDTRRAVARYVGRTHDFARRGMVLGLLGAVVLGVAWYQRITLGFGEGPVGDLVTMGLGGWFIGLLLSARYWHRPTGAGPRTAPLTPRDPDRYRSPALARTMVAVAALSGLLGLAGLLPGNSTERVAVAGLGVVTVAAMGSAARTQRRIARRPQPFVGSGLLAADEAMRVTSAQVIGRAGIGVGLVVVGWQASFAIRGVVGPTGADWWGFVPAAPLLAGLVLAARARRMIHPKTGPATAAAPAV